MKKKVLITLCALILAILPFFVGISITKYSPYLDTNSFQKYIIIWGVISIAFTSVALSLLKYFPESFERIGIPLFLLMCPIVGIIGLAAAPDLSLKMLEHPEREHIRYIFLLIAAILFGIFGLFLFRSNLLKNNTKSRRIISVVFIIAFVEFIWEFTHHYLYPEALKEWIDQGKNFEEFGKNYDNSNVITIGVIGRYCQYILIIWLSILFYKSHKIKIWSPIITIFLSSLGIISATVVYITNFNFPKGFEFLMLFFIPGFPFLLLYWLGIGLLTKSKKSEVHNSKEKPNR